MANMFSDAFKALNALNEDAFDITSKDGVDELKAFMDGDNMDDRIDVIDPEATAEDELKDSYVGKVILDCVVCHSKIFKDKDDVHVDEDTELVNVDEDCPYCYANDGFKVIGVIAPFAKEEEETETEVEVEEPIEESCKKPLSESYVDVDEVQDIVTGEVFTVFGGGFNTNDALVPIYGADEKKIRVAMSDMFDSYKWLKDGEVIHEPAVEEGCEKKLTEAPMYDLIPDNGRKSFYGKAKVITDDNGGEKLYSYNTLVAEMKDGKPVVYGTYSMTTLQHIKSWLKGHGFKAESGKQIMADYGAKEMEESVGRTMRDFQEKVDYEMEKYGRISGRTMRDIRGAGLSVVKDQYGEYEVISYDPIHEDFNPLADLKKDNIIEFPNGEYMYVGYEDGKLFAGSATNVGIIHEVEIDYDRDKSLDANLQNLYDAVVEARPELLGESKRLGEGVEVKTEEGKVIVETDDEKVTVEKNGCEECEEHDEVIEPVPAEVEAEIAVEEPEDVTVNIADFDEATFDELGEKYMKRVYENVESYKTTDVKVNGGKLCLEGVITFASGNQKKTNFMFESDKVAKDGRITFKGENAQISNGKKSFAIAGTLTEGVLKANSFRYDYRVKGEDGSSTRIHGTVSSKK